MEAGEKYAFAYREGKNCPRISAEIKKCLAGGKKGLQTI